MASSGERASDTYELLEQILLCLPIKDLFVVQRVSRTWKSIIQQSRGIRKKMFLLANGNPIVQKADPFEYHNSVSTGVFYTGCLEFNPAFEILQGKPVAPTGYEDLASYNVFPGDSSINIIINMADDRPETKQLGRSTLSYKSMLVTQPPITTMSSSYRRNQCTMYNPNGLTFGDLSAAKENFIAMQGPFLTEDYDDDYDDDDHGRIDDFELWLSLPPSDGARKGQFARCSEPVAERKSACFCIKKLLDEHFNKDVEPPLYAFAGSDSE